MDYSYILGVYRKLWNNRTLDSMQSLEETLKVAIVKELKDENSQPRVRKSLHEKFFLATKRIIESSLINEDKITLLRIYAEYANSINNEKEIQS